jgi:hypothetical protein
MLGKRAISFVTSAVLVLGFLELAGRAAATDVAVTNHDTTFDNIAPAWKPNAPPPDGYQTYPSGTCGATGQGFSDPQWVLVGDTYAAPFDPAKDIVTTLEGQVTSSKLSWDDNPIDHHSRDRNFFVFPDADYAHLLATPGNFTTGEGNEQGRIEVETESAAFPAWALPMMGDRVHVEGSWIWDCAHSDYRTEIHPPRLVMTLRDAADQDWCGASTPSCGNANVKIPARPGWTDTMPGLGNVPIPVTRADVFASSDGGEAREQLTCFAPAACDPADWYQPLKANNYDLFIPAPPKPDADAQLVTKIIHHPFLTASSDNDPGSLDVYGANPDPDPNRFTFTQEPVGNGEGIHIHIDFGGFTEPMSHLYGFGFTFEVGWNRPTAAANIPHRVKVTAEKVHVANTMDLGLDDDGEFEISSLIGDTFRHMILTPHGPNDIGHHEDVPSTQEIKVGDYGLQDGGSECALQAASGADPGPCQTSFDVTLLPGQPLRVFFRAEEQDPGNENDEAGTVERITTEAQNYGISDTPYTEWFQERTSAGNDALSDDIGSNCAADPCLSITYKIEDDPIPVPPQTTLTAGSPTVTQGADTWVTSASDVTLQASAPAGHEGDALDIHAHFWRSGTPAPAEAVCGSGTGTASCTLHLNANDGQDGPYSVEYWAVDTTTGAIEATQTKTLQLDNTPPRVAFGTPPTGSPYLLNQPVAASYSCIDRVDGMDGGVGVATCDGPVPNGGNLVTNPVGAYTFTVNTADQLGNATSQSTSYNVTYKICLQYDPAKPSNAAGYVFTVQLCDYNNVNVSTGAVKLITIAVDGDPAKAIPLGNVNPGNVWLYGPGSAPGAHYVYVLDTKALASGSHVLNFTVQGDPLPHTAPFIIKK